MSMTLSAVLGGLFFVSERWLVWRRNSARVANARRADGGTLTLLWVVIAGSIAAGLVVALRPVGPGLPEGFPWTAAAVTIFALGLALRWWAVAHLGRFFTVDVAVVPGHRVVDTGPYRTVRHPSYTGVLMEFAGWALSLGRVAALPVVLVPVFIAFLYRMRAEERALAEALGEEYLAYGRRTKRLVPGVY